MSDDSSAGDEPPSFLLDVMLGKLATYLRMCGIDAAYALDRDVEADDELLRIAREEGRTLVTRDRQLAAQADDAILLESKPVTDQLRELRAAGIELALTDPERCAECNAKLERVPAGARTPGYAPDLDEQPVWRCPGCDKHFWRGSHWDDVGRTLDEL